MQWVPEFPIGRLPKALNFSEDAHVLKVSTFETHLRGESLSGAVGLYEQERPLSNAGASIPSSRAAVLSVSGRPVPFRRGSDPDPRASICLHQTGP